MSGSIAESLAFEGPPDGQRHARCRLKIRFLEQAIRASRQRERMLYEALDEWGWHNDDCPAFDGEGFCDCGFGALQGWLTPPTRRSHRGKKLFEVVRAAMAESHYLLQHQAWRRPIVERLRAQHDLLVAWLIEAGRPLDSRMRQSLEAAEPGDAQVEAARLLVSRTLGEKTPLTRKSPDTPAETDSEGVHG